MNRISLAMYRFPIALTALGLGSVTQINYKFFTNKNMIIQSLNRQNTQLRLVDASHLLININSSIIPVVKITFENNRNLSKSQTDYIQFTCQKIQDLVQSIYQGQGFDIGDEKVGVNLMAFSGLKRKESNRLDIQIVGRADGDAKVEEIYQILQDKQFENEKDTNNEKKNDNNDNQIIHMIGNNKKLEIMQKSKFKIFQETLYNNVDFKHQNEQIRDNVNQINKKI